MKNMRFRDRWLLRWLIWRELGRVHRDRRQHRHQQQHQHRTHRSPVSHRLPLWRRFVIVLLDVFIWLLARLLRARRTPQQQTPASAASAPTDAPASTASAAKGRHIEWC